MRIVPAVPLAALALLAMADAGRAQSRCAPVDSLVALELDIKPAELSHERGIAELREAASLSDGQHRTGLYQVEIQRRSQWRVTVSQAADRVCLAVPEVRIRVEIPTRTIYVAHDLDRDSCLYEVTLDHERQHERIDEDFFRGSLPARVEALRGEFAALRTPTPVRVSGREQAIRDLHARAEAIVERMFVQFLADREQAQLAIDTPEEYARTDERCR